MTPDPFQPWLDRGVTAPVLARAQMRATTVYCPETRRTRPAWMFALTDDADPACPVIGHKVKYSDGLQPKGRWKGGRRDDAPACVFNLRCVVDAPTAFILEGEPDALLFESLGLPGCSLLCGAGTPLLAATIERLKWAGVGRFVVAYDLDDAGYKGAVKTTKALLAAGLRAHAIRLPASLGDGGDVGKLYLSPEVKRDRERFVAALASCQPLALPLDAPKKPTQPRVGASDRDTFNRSNDLVGLVEGAGVMLRPEGAWLAGVCPFHRDHTPSFKIGPERTLWKCFGCDKSGDAYWFDYLMRQRARSAA